MTSAHSEAPVFPINLSDAAAISRSVTLISLLCLLPGAETMIILLSLSAVMISQTLFTCSAFARELPPNFDTFSNPNPPTKCLDN